MQSYCHAIILSGPTFLSWSITVPLTLSHEEELIVLNKFNESIQFKTKIFGFAILPNRGSFDENSSKTKLFRDTFPFINLVTLYSEITWNQPVYSANMNDLSKSGFV